MLLERAVVTVEACMHQGLPGDWSQPRHVLWLLIWAKEMTLGFGDLLVMLHAANWSLARLAEKTLLG